MQYKSKDIAKASVIMAMSSREEEIELKEKYIKQGIKTAAVDIGGNVVDSISKILGAVHKKCIIFFIPLQLVQLYAQDL